MSLVSMQYLGSESRTDVRPSGLLGSKVIGSVGYNNLNMGVSKNRGTPKSSILIGFSFINHPFWGTPIFGNTHIPHL